MTEQQTQYSGFWRRVIAFVIDSLIYSIPQIVIIAFVIKAINGLNPDLQDLNLANYFKLEIPAQWNFLITAIATIIVCFLDAWFLSNCKWHATIGKRLLGIYVIGADSKTLSYKVAYIRSFVPSFVCILPLCFAGFYNTGVMSLSSTIVYFVFALPILFTKQKTGIHDMIVKSRVVKGRL